MKVLAGDIGGTKTLLAVVEISEGGDQRVSVLHRSRYESQKHSSLDSICRAFAGELGAPLPRAAGFGVAGPVVDGRCKATNLPWVIDAAELAAALKFDSVGLVNDFHALTLGIAALRPDQLAPLNRAWRDPKGPIAVIGAGTGLGEAIAIPMPGGRWHVLPTEGGHTDYAPRDELEIELLRFLQTRYQRVSWERVLSGEGLASLCECLAGLTALAPPAAVAEALRSDRGSAPALITAAALEGQDPLCSQAVERFCGLYGSEAGNLALKTLATGGIYLGGGIAPKIRGALESGAFRAAFLDKGRMRPLLERMPVDIVLTDDTGLFGAAMLAVP